MRTKKNKTRWLLLAVRLLGELLLLGAVVGLYIAMTLPARVGPTEEGLRRAGKLPREDRGRRDWRRRQSVLIRPDARHPSAPPPDRPQIAPPASARAPMARLALLRAV